MTSKWRKIYSLGAEDGDGPLAGAPGGKDVAELGERPNAESLDGRAGLDQASDDDKDPILVGGIIGWEEGAEARDGDRGGAADADEGSRGGEVLDPGDRGEGGEREAGDGTVVGQHEAPDGCRHLVVAERHPAAVASDGVGVR